VKYLVSYNGSAESKAALELAKQQARVVGARVLVVTSMWGGTKEKALDISQVRADLEAARQVLEEAGVDCRTHELARGLSPGEDLVRYAAECEADLMFVGIEKRSRTQKLLLGSTAQFIILKAKCPVVTVKA
jgi:nucleotide-binding universal stress UspA family protein